MNIYNRVLLATIALLIANVAISQQKFGLTMYKPNNQPDSETINLLKKSIDELGENIDPIVGIYSSEWVSIVEDVTGSQASNKSNWFCVIEPFDDWHSYHFVIERIGETNYYTFYFAEDYDNEILNPLCNTSLNSLYLFDFDFKQPQDKIDRVNANMRNNYHKLRSGKEYFKMIKQYPTRTWYEEITKKTSSITAWSGTGFAIGNKYIVTNEHVTDGAKTIVVKGVNGNLSTGYTAIVAATDKNNDIAILKINDSKFSSMGTIPYNVPTIMAEVGEDIFVLGYPLTQTMGNEIKLTNGIISSRSGFQGDVALYQMTAPIQPGNSGGPMFDSKGNVIGIVVAHHAGAENAGYAIKTSYLKNLIESAGLNIVLPSGKNLSNLSLSEKVKRIKPFVYLIECSK